MEQNMLEVRLPDLGEVEAVRVIEWLKRVGDRMEEGNDLVEVETEKTTFVIPAPASGRLVEGATAEGATVCRGDVVGEIEAVG